MSYFIDFIKFSKNETITPSKINEYWKDYKIKKNFQERKKESETVMNKYTDKVPIIINECPEDFKDRVKRKMLLQRELTVSQYLYTIRSKFSISPEESLLIFINKKMPTSSTMIGSLYDKNKDEDK